MDTRSWKHAAGAWLKSLCFALLIAMGIQVFLVQPFVVPTSSMAKTIKPGDYILVSKLHYGPRTPQSVGLPFLDLYVPGVHLPSARLPGLAEPERGDVVVFHYPPEKKPIDQKTAYVKRLVGLPGDTVEVQNGRAVVNGKPLTAVPTVQQQWDVHLKDPRMRLLPNHLRPLGIQAARPTSDPDRRLVTATPEAADALEAYSFVRSVALSASTSPAKQPTFPANSDFTRDEYGPVPVPRKTRRFDSQIRPGRSTKKQFDSMRDTAQSGSRAGGSNRRAAEPPIHVRAGLLLRDGGQPRQLTRQPVLGYVPEDHLNGEAVFTLFSWDREQNVFRVGRTLQGLE